jgi:hypothetical protein
MAAVKLAAIIFPIAFPFGIVLILGAACIFHEEGTISPIILWRKYRDYRLYRNRLCLELKKRKPSPEA